MVSFSEKFACHAASLRKSPVLKERKHGKDLKVLSRPGCIVPACGGGFLALPNS